MSSYILVIVISYMGKLINDQCPVSNALLSLKCLTKEFLSVININNIEAFSLLFLAILYLLESPDRKNREHYEAWQVIDNAASAKVSTSYARIQALESLNRDGVSLKGVDIVGADLQGINLVGANLGDADLHNADLRNADLTRADLTNSRLTGANLSGAILDQAKLHGSRIDVNTLMASKWLKVWFILNKPRRGWKLSDQDLSDACLSGAVLTGANLKNSNLQRCNLSSANLTRANLLGAQISGVVFSGSFRRDIRPSALDPEAQRSRFFKEIK